LKKNKNIFINQYRFLYKKVMTEKLVIDIINQSILVKSKILSDDKLVSDIIKVSEVINNCFISGGKLLFCGNGGSAADSQHLAAEFSGRFYKNRDPLFSESLSVNSSYITAVSNDYGYDQVYSRLVKAMGREGDVLVGISTSGNSKNVINAINTANTIGMTTIGFTGESGGDMDKICKYILKVPSNDTARIQESHIMIGHIICKIVEDKLF
jgi:D-sedoheptulose 7-phosphate isomerase